MTSAVFTKFLQQQDNKMGVKATKILFVDNAPCHLPNTTSLRNIKAVFLLPKCISHLQLLDAGIIKCTKQGYRKWHVQHPLLAVEHSGEEMIFVLDAMHMITSSLSAVSQSTIANSFKHSGFVQETASIASDSTSSMEDIATSADDYDFGHLNPATTFTKFVEVQPSPSSWRSMTTLLPAAKCCWMKQYCPVTTLLRHRTKMTPLPQMLPSLCHLAICYGT